MLPLKIFTLNMKSPIGGYAIIFFLIGRTFPKSGRTFLIGNLCFDLATVGADIMSYDRHFDRACPLGNPMPVLTLTPLQSRLSPP
jgi:hypothetical protein